MGIKPERFMSLDSCTLKVSGEIIKMLLTSKSISYSKIFKTLEEKYKDETDYILPEALSFLFLLGKIEYNVKKDKVRLIV
jgi:hypothetical protein